MTLEKALWMQNVNYEARADRILFDALWTEGVIDAGFVVSERASGANLSVDVAAGIACIDGDDLADQGSYLVRSTATENVAVTSPPGSDSRIDLVVLRVNDQQAGGAATNDITIEVLAGTPAASPSAPATPDSAIALAEIGPITSATAQITDLLITDLRPVAETRIPPNGGTINTTGGSIHYRKFGDVVFVMTEGSPDFASGSISLPVGFRPTSASAIFAGILANTNTSRRIIISTSGGIFHDNVIAQFSGCFMTGPV